MPLSAHLATTSMISTIHVLKAKAKFDDDTYRDFLAQRTGKRSAKELTTSEAGRVIEDLRAIAGHGPKGAVTGLAGAIGKKLRALWIAAYDLGLVRDRTDRAMLSYLERQTGVSHVRFLKESRDGTAAIEGLKAWLERGAGVDWPTTRPGTDEHVIASKRAVIDAQWKKLIALGDVKPIGQAVDPQDKLQDYAGRIVRQNRPFETMQAHDYDEVQNALGRKLRGALARRDQAAGDAA